MRTDGYTRIFVSYCHRGSGPKWKAALLKALQIFEQHHLLDVWQDGKIRVSSFWDDDIKQAMSNAQLAVVLLTKEALESQYITDTEFPFFRTRQIHDGLPVFPVICEKCDWRAHDWLRATQAPNGSNPLAELSENAVVHVFRKLATDIAEELSRIALAKLPCLDQPLPTNRIFLEKFPIIQGRDQHEEKLIGREQELALLDLALGQAGTAIVSLVAWGGVGKSMLVKHWLKRLQHENWFGAERVYAWSFYSQGTKEDRQASDDTFLAHALEWFGVQCEPKLSPWDKGRLLADAVTRERTLLVLDGIEPLQYPPGPMGGQLRAPGVQSFLKQLARKANNVGHRGLCLVTTREPLVDLADFQRREGSAWGSALRVDLSNLTDEAGAALLHHAGAKRAGAAEIRSDDSELLDASREVDGHALTLNLLGRFLARVHGGDIRRRDLVKFEEADRSVQGGTTFKMLAAFENWFARSGEFGARQLALLGLLSLFNRPADAEDLGALRRPPVIEGVTNPFFEKSTSKHAGCLPEEPLVQEDWNITVSFLEDFGLLTLHSGAEEQGVQLECHPLVREYFASLLRDHCSSGWRGAHQRLMDLYSERYDKFKRPRSIGELEAAYSAIDHGCKAGFHQLMCDLYYKHVLYGTEEHSWKTLGSVGLDLEAISCFFDLPWTKPVGALVDNDRGWVMNQAALYLQCLGRLQEATSPINAAIQMFRQMPEWDNAATSACILSDLELTLGNIDLACKNAKIAVEYADRSEDMYWMSQSRCYFARTFLARGEITEGARQLNDGEKFQSEYQPTLPLLYGLANVLYADYLLVEVERMAWQCVFHWPRVESTSRILQMCHFVYTRFSRNLESTTGYALDRSMNLLTVVRTNIFEILLSDSSIDTREVTDITDSAISQLRVIGTHQWIVRGLIIRSLLAHLGRASRDTQIDLDEAWDIAERGPMRLDMADIHLHRARLFFREQHYPWKSPADDLAAAERLINECGYHRRDGELADAKKAILGQ